MTELEIEERVQRAVDNFMAGYGCCQSVVAAFSDLYGLDETMAKRIAGDRRDVVTIRGTGHEVNPESWTQLKGSNETNF